MAKWMPYLTKEPSKIPDVADRLLNEFFQTIGGLKLRSCLAFGLCLGFVRDKAYIPGDNDLDLIVQQCAPRTSYNVSGLVSNYQD